jgi:hypothetical protein
VERIIVVLWLLGAASSAAAQSPCNSDSDCPLVMVCRDARCVSIVQGSPPAAPFAAVDPPVRRHGFYLRASLSAGYAHYDYDNGRNADGGLLGFSMALGGHVGRGVVVGATFALDPVLAISGQSSNRLSFNSDVAVTGYLAPMIGWVGDVVAFEFAAGYGGGHTTGTGPPAYGAGGDGIAFVPLLAFYLPSHSRLHFGFHLRMEVAVLFDSNLPDTNEVFVSASTGLSLMFF